MDKYFIGWSGNQPLALELASLIEKNTKDKAIAGGGKPKDMYIGAQVINQIQQCNYAVLLVEDKDGQISPNLMFEWGYLMARLPVNNIYTFLINKRSRDLPSDLLGTWVFELDIDRDIHSDKEISESIFEILKENMHATGVTNYFDLVNNWRQIFSKLSERSTIPDSDLCQYLITGCIAAYYYMDYHALQHELTHIVGSDESQDVVTFVKSYIDVFIKSENMMQPLPESEFFRLSENFESTLARVRDCGDEIEHMVDILCYNAYGLSCVLFLKNEGLDESTIQFCTDKALELFEKDIELVNKLEEISPSNKCFIQLMRAYNFNDLAHLYKGPLKNHEKFMELLAQSVTNRKALHQSFANYYNNSFLSIKLEQEYIIALSEQCVYMEESFTKRMSQNTIRNKTKEWERELLFTSSLTDRIKANIALF